MTTTNEQGRVAYDPTTGRIIDLVSTDDRAIYSNKPVADLRTEYPALEVLTDQDAMRKHDDFFRQAPKRITAERFDEMLNILPPMNWVRRHDSESFKLSERYSGNITSIFVRIGERDAGVYWEMRDHMRMRHDEIVFAVLKASGAVPA